VLSTSAASASPEGHDEIAALYHQVAAGAPLPIAWPPAVRRQPDLL
jgi:hypothetical protein